MEFRSQAIILSIVERLLSHGSWTGKTHVQKALSLLSESGRLNVPFEFVLYKHGPYSFDVESELEQMRSFGAVEVERNDDGYGVVLRPSARADYVKQSFQLSPDEESEIERICEFVGSRNVTELERLATAAWIRTREGISSSEDVAERLHQLKPHVSIEAAKRADLEIAEFLAS